MAKRDGPNMERHKTEFGYEVFLPTGCKLQPGYPKGGTEEEKRAWHDAQKDCQLYSIDK